METICQCINSLILQESVYIESRHEDLSVHQFSDPTRESVYIESRHGDDLSVHQFSDPTRECIYRE